MVYVTNPIEQIYTGGGGGAGGIPYTGPHSEDVTQIALPATRLEYTTVITDAVGFSIGFEMPRGLGHINDEGEMETHTVSISCYYKLSSSGTWIWAWTREKSAGTTTPQRWEETGKEGLAAGEYDIAIVNHADSTLDSNRYLDVLKVDYINAWPHTVYDLPLTAFYEMQIELNDQTGTQRTEKSVLAEGYAGIRIYTTTIAYTDNNYTNDPAWVWAALLTSDIFGFGYDYSDLDLQSFIDASTYFTANGITWNPYLDGTQNGADIRSRFQTECMCFVTDGGGGVKLIPDTTGSSSYSFDSTNMVRGSFSYSRTSIKDKINRVIVEYADADYNYKANTIQRDNDAAIVAAGNKIREFKMTLLGVVDRAQAEMIADRQLAYSEYAETGCQFETGLQALAVEVGDIIDITHDVPGWSGKLFRVMEITLDPTSRKHKIYAIEYDADIYGSHSWTASGGSSDPTEDTDQNAAADNVTGLTLTQGSRTEGDNTIIDFDIDWTNPVDADFDHVAIWVWPSDEGGWRKFALTEDDTVITDTYDDAKEGVTYKVAVCSVSVDDVENSIASSPQSEITIAYTVTHENATDIAAFDKDQCFILPDGTVQMQMIDPETLAYRRFIIERTKIDTEPGQSSALDVQEVTTGIGNAIVWPASTAVTANETICHPTVPDGTYYRCVTGGTTGATEPAWGAGTIPDGTTVEWELQDNQPVINNRLRIDTSGTASFGASKNGIRIIKMTAPSTTACWDFGWGEFGGDAGGYGHNGLTLLYSQNGKQFKAFRMTMAQQSPFYLYATIKDIEYDYFVVGSMHYAVPTKLTVSRPLAELPGNLNYALSPIIGGTFANENCGFRITGYQVQDNGDIWTTLEKATNAPAGSSASYIYPWVNGGSDPTVYGVGDVLSFSSRVEIYGQNYDNVNFDDFAPVSTPEGVGMVAQCSMSHKTGDPNTWYACKRFFLYRWPHPGARATITELALEGYETGWHGTADWENVTASLERVVTDNNNFGNNYGALVKWYLQDSGTPEYTKKLFVSENGGKFKEIVSWTDTSSIPSKTYGIGYHIGTDPSTYSSAKHLVCAYGDTVGTTYTVWSVTFSEQLYTGAVAGAIGNASLGEGATIALGYSAPSKEQLALSGNPDMNSRSNVMLCGQGQVYAVLNDAMFIFGPFAYDFTSSLPAGTADRYRDDIPYINNGEYFIAYSYGTDTDAIYKAKINIEWEPGTGYEAYGVSYTKLHIANGENYSTHMLAPLQGEPDVCVVQPTIDGTTFDGSTGSRIFIFRYDDLMGGEVGRIDGTVFHYYPEEAFLAGSFRLYVVNKLLRKTEVDTIDYDEFTVLEDERALATTADKAEMLDDGAGNTLTPADYNETLFWNGFDLQSTTGLGTLSWVDATRAFSIDVAGGDSDYHFWANGVKFTKTAASSVVIPDATGSYYIYFDNSGALQYVLEAAITMAVLYEYALVGWVYWNATAGVGMAGSERHGIRMSSPTHTYNHLTFGARYDSGINIQGLTGGGTTYTQTTSGYFWDEDIRHVIATQTTHRFLYRLGASGEWTWTAADNKVSYNAGGTYDVWNEYTGTTWQLTEGGAITDYWIIFYVAMPNLDGETVYKIIGQNAYKTVALARNAIESERSTLKTDGLPTPEVVFLYATIVKRDGTLQTLADGSTHLDLRVVKGSPANSTGAQNAGDTAADTTNFDGLLSTADTDVQKALDTIDDISHTDLPDIGTNTHAQIDTHIGTTFALQHNSDGTHIFDRVSSWAAAIKSTTTNGTYWGRFARFTMPVTYSKASCHMTAYYSWGAFTELPAMDIYISVKQGSSFGVDPSISLRVGNPNNPAYLDESNVCYTIVQNTPTTIVDFYIQYNSVYANMYLFSNSQMLVNGEIDYINWETLVSSVASSVTATLADTKFDNIIADSITISDLNHLGRTSSTAAPTTTELPTDKDFSLHKDTTTSKIYLAYNDGGTIKKVELI